MSRAFIREDVDPPERSGRKRLPSGLPPGAANYITARGAKRLREELQKLRAEPSAFTGADMPPRICHVPLVLIQVCVIRIVSVRTPSPVSLLAQFSLIR